MKVLLCAGGKISRTDSLRLVAPEGSFKGQILFLGKAMIQWVLDAVAQTSAVSKVYIVGYEGPVLHCKGKDLSYVKGGKSLVENLALGSNAVLKDHPNCGRLLWIGSDIPLIRPEMIEWFIEQINTSTHDIYYQIIPKAYMQIRFLDGHRTCIKLKKKSVYLADVHAFNPKVVQQNLHLCREVEKHRKAPFKIAHHIGIMPLLRFAFRQMTEEYVKEFFKKNFQLTLRVINSHYPEMGFDVDKLADYKTVFDYLSG